MAKKKIQIALAIDATGQWCAAGWQDKTEKSSIAEHMHIALDGMPYAEASVPVRQCIIETEVEVPPSEPKVVRGKTTKYGG